MSWEEAAGSGWYPSAGPEYSLSQPVGTPGEAAAVDSERGGAAGGGGLHPNSSSLTQPKSVPGLGHRSHQTFQPVALIGWRIAPWIQFRSPVGITGEWKESEAEGHT